MLFRSEALAQFDQVEKISGEVYKFDFNPIPLTRRLYAGRAFIGERQFDKAAATAEEIKGIVKRHNMAPDYLVFYDLLEAEIALAQNKPEDALGILDRASFHAGGHLRSTGAPGPRPRKPWGVSSPPSRATGNFSVP